jgi:hypothetical protein
MSAEPHIPIEELTLERSLDDLVIAGTPIVWRTKFCPSGSAWGRLGRSCTPVTTGLTRKSLARHMELMQTEVWPRVLAGL